MQFIQGNNRPQTYFSTLEDQVSADNAVRLIDAFIDKLDLELLGFTGTVYKSEEVNFNEREQQCQAGATFSALLIAH